MSKLDHQNLNFEHTSLGPILKELKKLDPKKAFQVNDVAVKIIIKKDIVALFIQRNLSNALSSSPFIH